MLARLGHFVVRRRRLVLIVALIAFAASGAIGGGAAKHLSSGGFDDPGAQATTASNTLRDHFGAGETNVVLLVTAKDGATADSPAVVAAGLELTKQLIDTPHVANVSSYWTLGFVAPLKSKDARSALILGRVTGSQNDITKRAGEIQQTFQRNAPAAVTVRAGGFGPAFHQVNKTVEKDLKRAELIAIPITAVLLVLVFGSGVAALLPLATGALSVVGTFLILRVLALFTEVSIFSLNLTTAMGLGLAIDYSLFVVTRYREELAAGHDPNEAVVRTVRTAGRTVAFSALTVAASLSALLVFPLAFLKSFAYAGVAVAALAGLCAVVVVPAMLAALGTRVNALTLWKRSVKPSAEGFWHRMAVRVMRRPIPFVAGTLTLLLFLGAPFLNLKLSYPDDRVLQPGDPVRAVNDTLRSQFSSEEAGAAFIVLPNLSSAGAPLQQVAAIDDYATRISKVPGVGRVDAVTGIYLGGQKIPATPALSKRFLGGDGTGTWMSVVPNVEPLSAQAVSLVHRLRDTPTPAGVHALVGGQSAQMADSNASMFSKLPIALGIIATITFVLLFWAFGSVVVPIKALVMNVLSLSATFGAMVWVFQQGHGSGLLHFTATGALTATMPILMFCVAFGLSMDYEVFLLSRIKEEHDQGETNELSVAHGLERTGRIVTALAVLMSVVFLAMATSHVSFIQLFGVGLTLAVLMDAFVIRGALVPAFMRLAGDANWWAPGPLRRLHDRYGFSEHVDLDGAAVGDGAAPAYTAAPAPNGTTNGRVPTNGAVTTNGAVSVNGHSSASKDDDVGSSAQV